MNKFLIIYKRYFPKKKYLNLLNGDQVNIKLNNGYELRKTVGKGEGIFATKCFKAGETVMIGEIKDKVYMNHSHASQTGENEYVLHAGSITKVNHSCRP